MKEPSLGVKQNQWRCTPSLTEACCSPELNWREEEEEEPMLDRKSYWSDEMETEQSYWSMVMKAELSD